MLKILCVAALVAIPTAGITQAAPNPWFGKWKLRLKDSKERPETLIYSDAGRGAMRMESVEDRSVIVTRFDGVPSPDIGKSLDNREPALAVKAVSHMRYTWTYYRAAKPYVKGVNTIAADGKTFTEVSWLVTKPSRTVVQIYDRQ